MLTEGTYRAEVSASFELSGVHTAPLVWLWWIIVVCHNFLDFRILGFGPPYGCLVDELALPSVAGFHLLLLGASVKLSASRKPSLRLVGKGVNTQGMRPSWYTRCSWLSGRTSPVTEIAHRTPRLSYTLVSSLTPRYLTTALRGHRRDWMR
jgi:hypothetical protein